MLKKIKTLSIIILSKFVYALSFLSPRKNDTWVFIGWHRNKEREVFADNSKYFFLHVSQKEHSIRSIWIGKDEGMVSVLKKRGYEAYSINSIKGIYFSLRAGYTITDSLFDMRHWRYSGGGNLVQLWHGKSPKKTGFDSPYGLTRYNKFLFPHLYAKPIFMIAASPLVRKVTASAFGIPESKLWVTGLPKHAPIDHDIEDMDIDVNDKLSDLLLLKRKEGYKKIVLFAPTFRPDGTNPISLIDLDKLNNILNDKKYLVVVTLHPKFSTKDYAPKSDFSNIIFTQSGLDIYPLFRLFDGIISDYSSTFLEFLLLNRSIILYAPDLEKYKREMGMYDEIWSLKPGIVAKDSEELINAIEHFTEDERKYEEARIHARKELFSFIDDKASERIVQIILKEKWKESSNL
jgi:CDP-glycerol glycerophosphotransferase (TagB/SpsB family)